MPGVPFEMKSMMKEFVLPGLREKNANTGEFRAVTNLLTTGIPESVLYDSLGNLDELLEGAKIAFLPSQFGTKMRITATASSQLFAVNKLTGIEQKIRSIVGRYIYGRDDDTLEEVVARLLKERGMTISVAESCTGGLISNRLTNISGSSQFYMSGIISYSNEAKMNFLKVPQPVIAQYGAVSQEVVRLMAKGAKAAGATDIALAISGIMGPTGATPEKPVGLTYIGICDSDNCITKRYVFGEDRLMNKDRAAQAALDMLRRYLLGIAYEE
jgi:nicotinamide-nucleotide amidase